MDDLVKKAAAFAAEKHAGQVDRGGHPYIEHPKAVASMLEDEKEKVVAWLHDTVEDTGATVDEIRAEFGDDIADAVDKMTRRKGVPYMDYIREIWENRLARDVKMADLRHNMDLSRIGNVSDEDRKRVEKYKKAYDFLSK